MSLLPKIPIVPNGVSSGGKQQTKSAENIWSEYNEVSGQTIPSATPTNISCDGTDKNKKIPSSGVDIWDTTLERFTLVEEGVYLIKIFGIATPSSNNSTLIIELYNTVTPSIVYESEILDLRRSGVPEPFAFPDLNFFAEITGPVGLRAIASDECTIDDITIYAERKV